MISIVSACARLSLAALLVIGLPGAPVSSPLAAPGVQAAAPRQPRPGTRTPRRPTPVKAEPKATDPAASEDAPPEPTLKRSNRMDLDARLVRGEAARSGAVYLFQRAPRRLPPLVNLHQSYLDEIVVPVLGATGGAPTTRPAATSAPSAAIAPTKAGGR